MLKCNLLLLMAMLMVGLTNLHVQAARDLSRELQAVVEEYEVPGMVAAVTDRNGILALGTAGVRQAGEKRRVEITDPFHLGSCGKAMTATVLAMLVEDGVLSWDMTLGEVFPENIDQMQPGYEKITLSQLLTHRSGMPANPPLATLDKWREYQSPMLLHEGRMLLFVETVQRPLEHQPGEGFLYSNLGYVTAALMAEQATGKVWERIVREKLFNPMKLKTAGFGPPNGTNAPARASDPRLKTTPVPMGHDKDGKPAGYSPLADNPALISPAGTIHMSVIDWAVFAQAHLDAGDGYPRMLSAATFEKMHTPAPERDENDPAYAMGWGVTTQESWTQGPALFHQGSNTLWLTQIWIAPKRDIAILVAANQGGEQAEKACNAAVERIVEMLGE